MSDKTTTAYWHGGAPGLKPGDNRKLHERRRLWRAWTKADAASVPELGPGPGRPTETIVTTAH